jgi:predicted SnoaL-like aldol condensation-catalyzing enzyme
MSFLTGGDVPLLITWTLLSLLTGAMAEGDTTAPCTPTIELEIGLPYECLYDNFVDGVCLTPTQIADKTVQALFVDFDVDAAQSLLAEDYIQHNPGVPTGAAPVLAFIPSLEESGLSIETHRTIAQGNLVAYHSTYTNASLFGGDTLIGFDVFRVENGKVQEHWDNLQELAGPNPNGNTMVDGPTMIKYLGETEANKELVLNLVNGVLVGGNASLAPLYISTEQYTQHNPTIADGLDGLAIALESLAAQNLSFDLRRDRTRGGRRKFCVDRVAG